MVEKIWERGGPGGDPFAVNRDRIPIARGRRDRFGRDRGKVAGLRENAFDVKEGRETGFALVPRAILDVDRERSGHRDRARVGLVKSRRVELRIGRAQPQGNLAIAERVRGKQRGDRLRPSDGASEYGLRRLDAFCSDADLTRNGSAIDIVRY